MLRCYYQRRPCIISSPPEERDARIYVGASHGLAPDVQAGRKELEKYLSGKAEEKIWEYTHVFTHRIWHMTAYLFETAVVPDGDFQWFSYEEYKKIPLAGPHARLAAYIAGYAALDE